MSTETPEEKARRIDLRITLADPTTIAVAELEVLADAWEEAGREEYASEARALATKRAISQAIVKFAAHDPSYLIWEYVQEVRSIKPLGLRFGASFVGARDQFRRMSVDSLPVEFRVLPVSSEPTCPIHYIRPRRAL